MTSSVLYFINYNYNNTALAKLITDHFSNCTQQQFNKFVSDEHVCYNLINSICDSGVEASVDTLVNYINNYDSKDSLVDRLLEMAFSKEWHSLINIILLRIIGYNSIYGWYNKLYRWSDWNYKTVIDYIESESNNDLYTLLLANYTDSYFAEFRSKEYYNILATIYYNNKAPFSNSDYKLTTLLDYSDICTGTIIALYNRGYITISDVCKLTGNNVRNQCISAILGDTYNEDLFIQVITSISQDDPLYDTYVGYVNNSVLYLFSNNYIDLEKLLSLHGTSVKDAEIFSIISYIYSESDDLITPASIDSIECDNKFKKDLFIYLFNNTSITCESLISISQPLRNSVFIELFDDDSICIDDIMSLDDSDTVCNVVNLLYSKNSLSIVDIEYIYKNYSDCLSDLNNDLRPLVGYMKFNVSNKQMSSDFYWAYSFESIDEGNWSNPRFYQSVVPPYIQDEDITYDGSIYNRVVICRNETETDLIKQSPTAIGESPVDRAFDLSLNNNKPSFSIEYSNDDVTQSSNINNGVVISFNADYLDNQFGYIYRFSLPGQLYTVNDNIIHWDSQHPLYKLLYRQRCYIDVDESNLYSNNYIQNDSQSSQVNESTQTDQTIDDQIDLDQTVELAVDDAKIIYDSSDILLVENMSSITRDFTLSAKPDYNVTLSLSSTDNSRLNISPSTLIFTQSNWDADQSVTFTAIDNNTANDTTTLTVTVAVSSNDYAYSSVFNTDISVNIYDNDTSGLNYNSYQINLTEGSSTQRVFCLKSKPTDDVVLSLSSTDNSRLSISPNILTFTPSNWSTSKQVTFTAIDDSQSNGNAALTVNISSSSNDSDYDNLTGVIQASIIDNDISLGTLAFVSDTFAVTVDKQSFENAISADHSNKTLSTSTNYDSLKHSFDSLYSEFSEP